MLQIHSTTSSSRSSPSLVVTANLNKRKIFGFTPFLVPYNEVLAELLYLENSPQLKDNTHQSSGIQEDRFNFWRLTPCDVEILAISFWFWRPLRELRNWVSRSTILFCSHCRQDKSCVSFDVLFCVLTMPCMHQRRAEHTKSSTTHRMGQIKKVPDVVVELVQLRKFWPYPHMPSTVSLFYYKYYERK